jgi:dihydroorotate dehydrogenase (NAD+) catalytic subunit
VAVENNPKLLRQVIKVLRDIAHPKGISVAVKISPNVGDPAGFAVRLEQAGADAITAINTVISRPVDPTLDIPLLGNPTGYGGK